ncbi:hypothetical protein M8A51_23570 [Schlegelella sp. S2-27]|uniref:ART-PolyVal-like domain-containing protein n=1 Tax=Caldimonas mangrovi TaxID=2944811 RepID=A0ABT0YUT9_9BURK|nr:hypothetical protein [Caldimonas mangrovi]MCM5682520.1 hypothetical protein [Caldimonas mangrovi]
MLNEIDQEGTDFALQQVANSPRRAPPPAKFSVWGTASAVPRGAAAATNESLAFGADVVGALGTFNLGTNVPEGASVLADAAGGFGAPEDVRRQAQREILSGEAASSAVGDTLRDYGRWYRPDPVTASTAEKMVFDFSRFATKAVGYSVLGGPMAGAAMTGADEGIAASDELRREGVDAATRVAVGAVTAATAAAGVALPVAGKTVAGTVGLTALGGPISFVGQQAATKTILNNAGYEDLAMQYDPLDPVGLFVSTLVPAGFGAFALRGAARRARAAQPVAEAAPIAPDAAPQQTQVSQAVSEAFPREAVDAARVRLAMEEQQSKSLVDPTDTRGVAEEARALDKASEQLARGERVNVTDVAPKFDVPVTESPAFRNWFSESKVVDDVGQPLVVYHGTRKDIQQFSREGESVFDYGGAPDSGGIFFTSRPADAEYYAGRQSGANIVPAYLSIENPKRIPVMRSLEDQAKALEQAKADGYDGAIIGDDEFVVFSPEQIKSAIGNSGRFDPTSGSLTDPLAEFAGQIMRAVDAVREEAKSAGLLRQPRPEPVKTTEPEGDAAVTASTKPGETTEAAPSGTEAASPEAAAAETSMAGARLAEIQRDFPDLEVMMDGMEKPMRLSHFLQQVKAQADEELAEAPLYEVAVQCALTNGT